MSDEQSSDEAVRPGVSTRAAEIVVALILLGLGGLVVYDSVRLGFKWGSDGPEAGYFPFYIGFFICAASVITLGQVFFGSRRYAGKVFVEWGQLKLVMSVLVPAVLPEREARALGLPIEGALKTSIVSECWFTSRLRK